MYITAQRVQSKSDAALEGINAFFYTHDGLQWTDPPLPTSKAGCGKLVNCALTVAPIGGNPVHSYLDIVAPDGTSFERCCTLVVKLATTVWTRELGSPWPRVLVDGDCMVRFELDNTVLRSRSCSEELALLLDACTAIARTCGL